MSENTINIKIDNVKSKIEHINNRLSGQLNVEFACPSPNYWFSPAFKNGHWDGKVHFYNSKNNTFPTGLLPKVINFLQENEYEFTIEDIRCNEKFLLNSKPIKKIVLNNNKVLRDYQVNAVNSVSSNHLKGVSETIPFQRGIINIATNGGKTVIASAIIREVSDVLEQHHTSSDICSVFLFLTHSKEIAIQSKASLETDLDIPVGFIGDGKWVLKPVTVALIPTLYSKFKKKDDKYKALCTKVVGFIADECLSGHSKVLLPDNKTMTIKEICERDDITEVVSYNETESVFEKKKILRKMVTPATEQFWKIWYDNPVTGKREGLVATRNHKVWTENRGYVRVDELTTDDIIKLNISNPELCKDRIQKFIFNHNVNVAKISKYIGIVPKFKYNLEVEDNHNYFADNILVSNCHHSSSNSWVEVMDSFINANMRLGLTGTVDKTEPLNEVKLNSVTGNILIKISNNFLIKDGYSAKPECYFVPINYPDIDTNMRYFGNDESEGRLVYSDIYQRGVVKNSYRNYIISKICKKELQNNNQVLILVEHIEQGVAILNILERECHQYSCTFLHGELSSEERQLGLNMLKSGDIDVLIATAILDEGIDISNINAVIYARGMKSLRKLLQGIGRGLRKKSDNSVLKFYDFIDDTSLQLLQHSLKRYEILKHEKFGITKLDVEKDLGFDSDEWDYYKDNYDDIYDDIFVYVESKPNKKG